MKYGLMVFFGLIVVFLGLSWVAEGNEFFLYQFFAPKTEAVRRQVFEQSKAYNQGMQQELENMQMEWEQASSEHKSALRSLILHRVADYDEDKMSSQLRNFVDNLRASPTTSRSWGN